MRKDPWGEFSTLKKQEAPKRIRFILSELQKSNKKSLIFLKKVFVDNRKAAYICNRLLRE